MTHQDIQNKSEDKTYENETQESTQSTLYAEVKKLRKENDELRLFKIKAVEEAKKEADNLMINKCLKYEDEINEIKKDNKKLAKQVQDLEETNKMLYEHP